MGLSNGIPKSKRAAYYGAFVHSRTLEELEFFENTAVFVDENGTIEDIVKDIASVAEVRKLALKKGWMDDGEEVVIRQSIGEDFFFPGFIGTE